MRHRTKLGIAVVITLLAASGCVIGTTDDSGSASSYPNRGISILAPGATGGGWDTRARGIANALTQCDVVDEDVTVTNTPGAGGTIGLADFITKKGPYQLMVMDTVTMTGGIVRNHSPIDIATLTPIAGLTTSPGVILVAGNSAYGDLGALVAAMKAAPRNVSFVGGSLGGPDHIKVAALARANGVPVNQINYVSTAGGGEAVSLLLSGAAAAGVASLAEVKGQVAAGQLRVLAVTDSAKRIDGINAPTLAELGYNELSTGSRGGVLAPPGLSSQQQRAVIDMLDRMRKTDCWQQTLRQNNWTDGWLPGDEFGNLIDDHRNRITSILSELGLTS